MKSEGKKFLNIFLLNMIKRTTSALKQSPCYVVRLACAVAFVLPLFMDAALMEARCGLLPLFEGRGNSGKMTHNVLRLVVR